MNTAHTPEPWQAENPDCNELGLFCVIGPNGEEIADLCEWAPQNHPEQRANKALIIAAPDLLAALEDVELRATQARIASTIGKRVGKADFLRSELERIGDAARAAIAKATGEA